MCIYSSNDDRRIITELKIDDRQLGFLKLLVHDPSLPLGEQRKQIIENTKWFNATLGISHERIADLISREIIIDNNQLGTTYYDCYEIAPQYADMFELNVYGKPYDLFMAYPKLIQVDKKSFFARNCSVEEISTGYIRAIKDNDDEHAKVMNLLSWGKKHNNVKVGLKKFVDTRYWEVLEELKSKNNGNIDVKLAF